MLSHLPILEESLQMPQLPYTSHQYHHDLRQTIPNSPRISTLAQIPKIRLPLPLILLFSSYVLQLQIQVANFRCQLGYVPSVVFEVCFCCAYYDVEVETDVGVGEPGGIVCGEAERVVTCFVGGECEAAFGGAFGFYNCVRGFYFLDFDEYAKLGLLNVFLLSFRPFQSLVMALYDSICWYFLDETAFLVCIEVEVESVCC